MVKRAITAGTIFSFIAIAVATRVRGDNQQAVQQATQASEAWLKLVDAGEYGPSYDQAASYFKSKVTRDGWIAMVDPVRKPLGPVTSRKLKDAQYATSLPGAPEGQYVVVQYDTSFVNKKSAVETITPMLDKDGKWRVSGYFIR